MAASIPKTSPPAALTDPEILRLSETMAITESDAYNAAFPAHRFAHATLVLKDGRRLTSPRTEAHGDPENPAPMSEVRAKFHAWADPVLGPARSAAIETAVDTLDTGSLAPLSDLVLAPEGPNR